MGGKTATWSIAKGDQVVTVSPAAVTLNTSARSAKFTVTRKGGGVISAISNSQSVATVSSVNQITGEVTVNSVKDTTGTTTITVKVAEGDNYLAGADKQIQVKAQFVTIYGVEWDWTSSGSTKGKRTDGAAGFGDPNPAVNNGSGSSPFDNLYPWRDMTKVTRTGGVMVKEPKYWFKWTKTGKKLKLQIADGPVEGFHVDPVNMDRAMAWASWITPTSAGTTAAPTGNRRPIRRRWSTSPVPLPAPISTIWGRTSGRWTLPSSGM